MASRILMPRRLALPTFSFRSMRLPTPATTAAATSLIATPLLLSSFLPMHTRMDSFSTQSNPLQDYQKNAKTPVVKDGKINQAAFRQISSGSIFGLLGGVVVSFFSKPLALLIGLFVVGAQVLESKAGIHIIPWNKIPSAIGGVNLKSLQDNVAFKLSFGVTFALAAFAQF